MPACAFVEVCICGGLPYLFIKDEPVVAFLLLLGISLVIVFIVSIRLEHRKKEHPDIVNMHPESSQSSRFLGTQVDLAIVIVGLLLLLLFAAWLKPSC
jgi:hypothetical protein